MPVGNQINARAERQALGRGVGKHLTRDERREVQDIFLETFAASGVIMLACRAAGVTRQGIHYWNEHDAGFNVRYGLARAEADDRIRAEINRRAMVGTTKRKTVTENGQVTRVEEITEISDVLLIFLAKSRMPEFQQQQYQVKYVMDEEALAFIADIITRNVTDQDTLSRLRSELSRIALSGEVAGSSGPI